MANNPTMNRVYRRIFRELRSDALRQISVVPVPPVSTNMAKQLTIG
jgi:hypothetical protein